MLVKKNIYIAIIFTLFIPYLGMLNINQVKKSIIYFFMSILAFFAGLTIVHYGFFKEYDIYQIVLSILFLVAIIASIDCYKVLTNNNGLIERKWFSRWYVLPIIFITTILFFYPIRVFILEPYAINNQQKILTINTSRIYTFVTKPLYRYLSSLKGNSAFPNRGQVIIYRQEQKDYFARVIGCPGDVVELDNNILYINGIDYYHNFLKLNNLPTTPVRNLIYITDSKNIYEHSPFKITIPEKTILLGADNISLYPGLSLVPTEDLIGEIKYLIWDYKNQKWILKEINDNR